MEICVVGTGYVGLVTGTCLAETGNRVTCVDIDQSKIDLLNSGEVPIFEPGLEVLFQRNRKGNRLHFTENLEEGIKDAEVIFLALPTPPNEDGTADLQYVLKVAEELSKLITHYVVIVDKSTVPVGTAEKVSSVIEQNLSKDLFDVVSNPEFLKEGVAVDDFMKPDRVVVGASSEKALDIMERLYRPFIRQGNPFVAMDLRSAEMTKYAANSYLATRITFMNEIANLCEVLGANVDQVREGIGLDKRIGKRFLFPGIGYGGSCFPKDVQALHRAAQHNDYDFQILDAVMKVNALQRKILVQKLNRHFDGKLKGLKISLWGLAFKPNTDDVREAPSLYIIEELLAQGAIMSAYDPEAMKNIEALFPGQLRFGKDQYDVLVDADALLILTEWHTFRTPNFEKMKNLMNKPIIFDGRNVFSLEEMKNESFQYYSIGRD